MRTPPNEAVAADIDASPPAGGRGSRGGPTPSPSREREGSENQRTCVLTRAKGDRDDLIRLALGPDGSVAPDVRARAPGRGAWIGVARPALDEANAKGRLKGALQRAFKAQSLTIPADLGERTEAALRQTALDRLGMEARAGNLINGAEKVETAARSGKVALLLHAADSGEDGRRKLDQAWRVGGGGPNGESRGVIFPESRPILSMALGRENVVHVALTNSAAAARVLHALQRWRAFTDPDCGLSGGDPAPAGRSTDDDDVKE